MEDKRDFINKLKHKFFGTPEENAKKESDAKRRLKEKQRKARSVAALKKYKAGLEKGKANKNSIAKQTNMGKDAPLLNKDFK